MRRGSGVVRVLGVALGLVGLLALGGCIGVVLPTFSKRDPGSDAARWLATRKQAATRAEVLLHFGAPDFASEPESLWVYRWHDPRAYGFFCVAAMPGGTCVALDYAREFDLVLRFGADGRLERMSLATGLERGTATRTTCTPDGLCVAGMADRLGRGADWVIPLLDLERAESRSHLVFERDVTPEDMPPPEVGCRLAVLPASVIASIFVDGVFAGLAARDGWLRLDVTAGEHVVAIRDVAQPPSASRHEASRLAGAAGQPGKLTCRDGERVFVEQAGAGLFGRAGGDVKVAQALEARAGRPRARRYLAP